MLFRTVIALLCLLLWAGQDLKSQHLLAQDERDHRRPLQPETLINLDQKIVDVQMRDGSVVAFQTVTLLGLGKDDAGVRALKVQGRDKTKSTTLTLNKIEEIFLDDQPLDVAYDRKSRSLIFDEGKRAARVMHEAEVFRRLAEQRHRYWEPLSESAHAKFLDKHRKFVAKTKAALPDLNLHTVETKFYIFTTDLPPSEVNGYIVYLDTMYRTLCQAFGLSSEKNLWCGKCVVMAFGQKQTYLRFEKELMNTDAEGSQGLCHQSSDGTVIFAGYKGESGFAHVLVHETTHGFVHRYLSTARIPSWLNEGISDWIANAVVGGNRIESRQRSSALFVTAEGGWGDFLETKRIQSELYGTASSLVELLLARDQGGQFKLLVVRLKEGNSPEQALQESFGLSYNELTVLYARAIRGVR